MTCMRICGGGSVVQHYRYWSLRASDTLGISAVLEECTWFLPCGQAHFHVPVMIRYHDIATIAGTQEESHRQLIVTNAQIDIV
jgi:hypothetical protein